MGHSPACGQQGRLVGLVLELLGYPLEVGLAILQIVQTELDLNLPQSDEEHRVLAAVGIGRVRSALKLPE